MPTPEIFQKSPIRMELEPGTYYWCACGKSQNQPFCDGSHKGSEFTPQKFEITEAKMYSLCACKHSQLGWKCDGTHKTL